jgi:hypothetical protein
LNVCTIRRARLCRHATEFNAGSQHGESIGAYGGDPLYHASLSTAEYEAIIARFGFHVLQYATNDVDAGGRTVWLCQRGNA